MTGSFTFFAIRLLYTRLYELNRKRMFSHSFSRSRLKDHNLSGHWDLNPGPLAPHASALAGLRHAPNNK